MDDKHTEWNNIKSMSYGSPIVEVGKPLAIHLLLIFTSIESVSLSVVWEKVYSYLIVHRLLNRITGR